MSGPTLRSETLDYGLGGEIARKANKGMWKSGSARSYVAVEKAFCVFLGDK